MFCLFLSTLWTGVICPYTSIYDDFYTFLDFSTGSLNKVIEAKEASGEKGKEPASSDDPVVMARQELDELREILPDIMSKVRTCNGLPNVMLGESKENDRL